MRGVLTTKSDVSCGHEGTVAVTGLPRLRIDGGQVLVKTGVATKAVASCATPLDTNTGSKPCTTVTGVSSGEASKLRVDGQAVLTKALGGETDGSVSSTTPQLLLSAMPKQTLLRTD